MIKHLKGEKHKRAANLQTKSEMGAEAYQQNVADVAQFFKGLWKWKKKTRQTLYLAKMERPFSDYNNLLKLQIKKKSQTLNQNTNQVIKQHCLKIILEGKWKSC